jgi:Uma2 family endonuclease
MPALRKTQNWRPMTVEQFFALPEDPRHKKRLLLWGEIRLMNPPMPRHSAIQKNIAVLLSLHLNNRKMPCFVGLEAGIVPALGSDVNYLQPDAIVTCEKIDDDRRTFREPVIVFEILSLSNQRETRSKLPLYTSMPSVAEIVFLHSARPRAEIWRKSDAGEWAPETELVGKGQIFRLPSLSFETPIDEFYQDTGLL